MMCSKGPNACSMIPRLIPSPDLNTVQLIDRVQRSFGIHISSEGGRRPELHSDVSESRPLSTLVI